MATLTVIDKASNVRHQSCIRQTTSERRQLLQRSVSVLLVASLALSVAITTGVTGAVAQITPTPVVPSEMESDTVLSMVFADWDDDSVPDRASLVKQYDDHDYATLVVDLSSVAGQESDLVIKLDDFAWDGLAAGTRASLSLSEVGSLIVNSGNKSVGRDRWQHRLYIAYRRNNLVVAGFYYGTRDTITNDKVDCDVNYLAGYGYKNKERFTFARNVIELADWSEQKIRDLCE